MGFGKERDLRLLEEVEAQESVSPGLDYLPPFDDCHDVDDDDDASDGEIPLPPPSRGRRM